ncbi:MAG: amidinotransferase [Candidatus Saganbacteria bacterium]|nr:amidinotransferase [Candidatus Saganbacteria bacterium]
MDGKIRAEWEPLKKVVMRLPGIEMFFGLMEPYGSLYERAFSQIEARNEHKQLQHILRHEFNVEVLSLEDTIVDGCQNNPQIRQKLVKMLKDTRSYKGKPLDIEMAVKEFDDDAQYLDSKHFFNALLLDPVISIDTEKGARNIHLNITDRQPLANLYFMRDQQFVCDQGIVLCRMAKPARRREPEITKFLFEEVLGIPLLYEMEEPATIEGGEFIPMGDFALIGIGDRTNRDAINQLLSLKLGYKEIAVVHQAIHPLIPSNEPDPMINMHLDTYFNVCSSKVVVGCELLLKCAQVEIFHKNDKGKYIKAQADTTLHEYITKKGFKIINITTLEQMSYASNFLCIKDSQILAIEVERVVPNVIKGIEASAKRDPKRYGKLLEQIKKDYTYLKDEGQFFPHKKEIYQLGIDAYPIVLENLTGGYGGAHCMTCALNRG